MLKQETATMGLQGSYRDVLVDAAGQVAWDRGWRKNTIVIDCRRLLAGFVRGEKDTLGIQGLRVGAGDPAWDGQVPPAPSAADTKLVDPSPYLVQAKDLKFDYIDPETGHVSTTVTNRLQIVATLGPRQPDWPEKPTPIHPAPTLREFGLVGQLGGATVLLNAVRHVAVIKDPLSTLVRTIQLVF